MPEPAGPLQSQLPESTSAPLPPRGGRSALLAALLLAVVLGALDSSMLNLAFRELIDDLASSTTVVVWVALAYLIAATAPMMLMTRVAETIGHGRSFQIGVVLYGVTTVLCGMADDVGSLIALRSLQGFGMAMFVPSALVLCTAAHAPGRQGRALGILLAGGAFGLVLGAPLGGWLLDVYGWRAIFLARLPLIVLAIVLALWAVRREPLGGRPLLASLGLGHRGPGFVGASLASIAMFASLSVCFFILPMVLLGGPETSAWHLGLMLGSAALIAMLVAPLAGKWSGRFGPERLCVLGAACAALGHLALIFTPLRAPLWQLTLPLVLIGAGTGLFLVPNRKLLLQDVPSHHQAMACALVGTLRLGGYALGFAIVASFMTLMQDRLEYVWDGRAGMVMPPAEALRFEQLFQRGGAWSTEVLTLLLQVAALLGAAILLIALVCSIRAAILRPRGYLLVAAASVAVVGLATPALLERSSVVGTSAVLSPRAAMTVPAVAPFDTSATVSARAAVIPPPVAPFGMASRPRIELPAAPGTLGGAGGAEIFAGLCAACHGDDGRGLPAPQGFKIDLTTSRFVTETSDLALAEFIRSGRSIDDPRNTTGMPMPAMAGVLSEERIARVVQYLRQIRR
ncbi:MAG: MFS transporter [Elusimicrobia bacterium]|nr:MAG: MFS transporter [Elusimicrobiota bacterium]